MAMKDCATAEMKRIQRKYINENGTQKRGMLAEGPDAHKHLTSDELFEISNVLRVEPKIGRLANDRKRANELIAMPRGLLHVLLDELGYLIYCEEHREEIADGMRSTRAPLEAQEPRVMTLEEVEAMPYGHVLIETDKSDSLRWLDALLFCKNANFQFDFITLEGRARLLGTEYNRGWRCWTSRPTDEQREAVKWE